MTTRSYDVLGRSVAVAVTVLLVAGCSGDGSSGPVTSDSATTPSPTADDASTDLILDVPIGERSIHVTCFGPDQEGVPTVLFESGGGAPSDAWDRVVDLMAPTRRVCSYDRAGLGGSPAAPEKRRTTEDLVDDLEATLAGAGVEGPLVLVSWSIGVLPLVTYTDRHRPDVEGVVLVDPRPPRASARFLAALPPPRKGEPEPVRIWRDEDLGSFEHDPSLNPEHLDITACYDEANALLDPPGPFFGDLPLVLLSASGTPQAAFGDLPPRLRKEFERIHSEEQHALADESTNGRYQVVSQSGHEIPADQPQAIVDAVEDVLGAVAG
jgi:pimeloyl-ACP methyl ester carboxylesterase